MGLGLDIGHLQRDVLVSVKNIDIKIDYLVPQNCLRTNGEEISSAN
jgi:hypothetical protein